jgi:hypothetical protein
MKPSHPPRLAIALLRRFVADSEPLVGDLIEQFGVRQSRVWFWRQTLLAMVFRPARDPEPPLGLGAHSRFDAASIVPAKPRVRRVNMTASPIPDVGGLGLVALGVIVALARPNAWLIFLPAIAGGVILGAVVVMVRAKREPNAPPS